MDEYFVEFREPLIPKLCYFIHVYKDGLLAKTEKHNNENDASFNKQLWLNMGFHAVVIPLYVY